MVANRNERENAVIFGQWSSVGLNGESFAKFYVGYVFLTTFTCVLLKWVLAIYLVAWRAIALGAISSLLALTELNKSIYFLII